MIFFAKKTWNSFYLAYLLSCYYHILYSSYILTFHITTPCFFPCRFSCLLSFFHSPSPPTNTSQLCKLLLLFILLILLSISLPCLPVLLTHLFPVSLSRDSKKVNDHHTLFIIIIENRAQRKPKEKIAELLAIPVSGRLYGRMNGKSTTTTGVLARQLNRSNALLPTPSPFLTIFFLFFHIFLLYLMQPEDYVLCISWYRCVLLRVYVMKCSKSSYLWECTGILIFFPLHTTHLSFRE